MPSSVAVPDNLLAMRWPHLAINEFLRRIGFSVQQSRRLIIALEADALPVTRDHVTQRPSADTVLDQASFSALTQSHIAYLVKFVGPEIPHHLCGLPEASKVRPRALCASLTALTSLMSLSSYVDLACPPQVILEDNGESAKAVSIYIQER